MKLHLGVLGVFVATCALMALGACSDDTGTATTSSSSSSSGASSSSGSSGSSSSSSGMSSSSSSSSGGGSSSSSASSSSGNGMYTTCSECTSDASGAYTKECKAQRDACLANSDCAALAKCSYDNCILSTDGGCCTRTCAKDLNTPMAAWDLFYALDSCVFCMTCTDLCEPDFDPGDYCKVIAPGGESMCPP